MVGGLLLLTWDPWTTSLISKLPQVPCRTTSPSSCLFTAHAERQASTDTTITWAASLMIMQVARAKPKYTWQFLSLLCAGLGGPYKPLQELHPWW